MQNQGLALSAQRRPCVVTVTSEERTALGSTSRSAGDLIARLLNQVAPGNSGVGIVVRVGVLVMALLSAGAAGAQPATCDAIETGVSSLRNVHGAASDALQRKASACLNRLPKDADQETQTRCWPPEEAQRVRDLAGKLDAATERLCRCKTGCGCGDQSGARGRCGPRASPYPTPFVPLHQRPGDKPESGATRPG